MLKLCCWCIADWWYLGQWGLAYWRDWVEAQGSSVIWIEPHVCVHQSQSTQCKRWDTRWNNMGLCTRRDCQSKGICHKCWRPESRPTTSAGASAGAAATDRRSQCDEVRTRCVNNIPMCDICWNSLILVRSSTSSDHLRLCCFQEYRWYGNWWSLDHIYLNSRSCHRATQESLLSTRRWWWRWRAWPMATSGYGTERSLWIGGFWCSRCTRSFLRTKKPTPNYLASPQRVYAKFWVFFPSITITVCRLIHFSTLLKMWWLGQSQSFSKVLVMHSTLKTTWWDKFVITFVQLRQTFWNRLLRTIRVTNRVLYQCVWSHAPKPVMPSAMKLISRSRHIYLESLTDSRSTLHIIACLFRQYYYRAFRWP